MKVRTMKGLCGFGLAASVVACGPPAAPLEHAAPEKESQPFELQAREVALVSAVEGVAAQSQAPLAAAVSVQVVNATQAIVQVTNTSPPTSSTEPGAPILTQLAFNLLGGPAANCLVLSTPASFSLSGSPQPFCGLGGAGNLKNFAYALVATTPLPKNGLKVGQSAAFTLTVAPQCQSSFSFSPEVFSSAPASPSGGKAVQWAARFQVVGKGGEDSGCAQGNTAVPPQECQADFTWTEFVATAADLNRPASLDLASDPRAGSVEINHSGGEPFGTIPDDSYAAAILTLRNGRGEVLEQWHQNRAVLPLGLPNGGCELFPAGSPLAYLRCWQTALDANNGVLEASVPSDPTALNSNSGFDADPATSARVRVSGESAIDISGAPTDNSAQSMRITWDAPAGIASSQLLFRGRYDWSLDGLGANDPFVTLFQRNLPSVNGVNSDFAHPSVTVVHEDAHSLTIEVNTEHGVDAVCKSYGAAGITKGPSLTQP